MANRLLPTDYHQHIAKTNFCIKLFGILEGYPFIQIQKTPSHWNVFMYLKDFYSAFQPNQDHQHN